MNTYPNEPLTPEERELAQLTARLGPHGEPSPTLDARILGAAHAAIERKPVRKPGPRWPVAMGLAASVVFAVGIAWQLRPLQQAATVAEAPGVYSSAEETTDTVAPAAVAGSAAASADSVPSTPAAEPAADVFVAAPAKSITPPPPPPPAPAQASPVSKPRAREQAPPTGATRPSPYPAPSGVFAETSQGNAMPAMAPPPPPAPIPLAEEPLSGFAADMPATSMAREEKAAARQESNVRAGSARQASARDAAPASAAIGEAEGDTLDRVEVTGSRIKRTDLQVPVSDDSQLAVDEWLERVRTRYGLGDTGAARRSLLLFIKDHPEEPVPGDLEPLLQD